MAIFVAASLTFTWPMARDFFTRSVGDHGDPYAFIWAMRWTRDALLSFQNPFFTRRLYHPDGIPLIFDALVLPTTLPLVPLWGLLPEVTIYNVGVLFAYTLGAYAMFRLVREVTNDTSVAIAAGVIFTATPYHSAHLQGHLNLLSTGWVLLLYLVHLLRVISGRARARDSVLAGVFLALASLSSWYFLLFAAVLSAPLIVYGIITRGGVSSPMTFLRHVCVLVLTWSVFAGPLFVTLVLTRQGEDLIGGHDPSEYSADGYSFFVPSVVQTTCRPEPMPEWIGYVAEHATYAGISLLVLALVGTIAGGMGRAFLGVAIVGALLAVGPELHWKGENLGTRMPYSYLQHFVPALALAGVPVRFGFVMYVGLIPAAACGVAWLRTRVRRGPLAFAVVIAFVVAALYEYWSCPVPTTRYPVPTPLREWAKDPAEWAVLDVTGPWQQMWNATIHGKPIMGGYVGRVPKRLKDRLAVHPVIRAIQLPDAQWVHARIDPRVDFAWGGRPPDGSFVADRFNVVWSGTLLAPADGVYRFWLTTTFGAELRIDNNRGAGQMAAYAPPRTVRELSREIALTRGPHTLVLTTMPAVPDDEIHLSWAPPGEERQLVPTEALRASNGQAGVDGRYEQYVAPMSGLGRERGRDALRDLGIRYVITGDIDNPCLQRELELPLEYRGEGVRIYRVEGAGDAASSSAGG